MVRPARGGGQGRDSARESAPPLRAEGRPRLRWWDRGILSPVSELPEEVKVTQAGSSARSKPQVHRHSGRVTGGSGLAVDSGRAEPVGPRAAWALRVRAGGPVGRAGRGEAEAGAQRQEFVPRAHQGQVRRCLSEERSRSVVMAGKWVSASGSPSEKWGPGAC